METLTEDVVEAPAEAPVEEKQELEERDPSRLEQRKPPHEGPCRRCGNDKPINRLMLCYPCWVKTILEEKAGWREGMPHPEWCHCEGLPDHVRRSDGN
ncbi:MAG: hypothetical protein HY554_04085 [Elusimicrobia bacterium]|nr:hypothetical protein [Elusimicrobiota bacterium]